MCVRVCVCALEGQQFLEVLPKLVTSVPCWLFRLKSLGKRRCHANKSMFAQRCILVIVPINVLAWRGLPERCLLT